MKSGVPDVKWLKVLYNNILCINREIPGKHIQQLYLHLGHWGSRRSLQYRTPQALQALQPLWLYGTVPKPSDMMQDTFLWPHLKAFATCESGNTSVYVAVATSPKVYGSELAAKERANTVSAPVRVSCREPHSC